MGGMAVEILLKRKLKQKGNLNIVLCFVLSFIVFQGALFAQEVLDDYQEQLSSYVDVISYSDYVAGKTVRSDTTKEYVITAKDYSYIEGMEVEVLKDYKEMKGDSLYTDEEGLIEWEVTVEEDGLYNMAVTYYPIEGKSSDIERGIFIDGQLPFSEANLVKFNRFWINALEDIQQDNQGNDLRPTQIESPRWSIQLVKDSKGYYIEPFQFYLSKGTHTITFLSQREPMIISEIRLCQEEKLPTYSEKLEEYKVNGYKNADTECMTIQAETATLKSSPMLYAVTDHSSPAIYPYSPKSIRLNTIGGATWRASGQWIEWEIEVPEAALYQIGLNVKQNFIRGNLITRALTIDGNIPFEEARQIEFTYKKTWQSKFLGDGNEPYLFYLEPGKHTLRLEVVLGDLAEPIREVQTSIRNLNEIYLKIIMVVGTEPDKYRDYQLEKSLPEVISLLEVERDRLNRVADEISSMVGASSDRDAILRTLSNQIDLFCNDINKVTYRINDFKENIRSVGTWLMDIANQPLQLDAIYIAAPGGQMPKTNNSFVDRTTHTLKKLYYSFVVDYNAIGNVSEDKEARNIKVWVNLGRDQANTIKALIDESFTVETGINVNLMLVQKEGLLPATLAGQGPDVAMQVTNDIPMDYAMRGAVVDLTQFEDYEEVASRFYDSANVPYTYGDAVYALPETETFYMLFYRKDILKELGLEVPKTWDDVKVCLSVLSKNSMQFGLPPTTVLTADMVFGNFLYQMGGEFYTEDRRASALDSNEGINAFKHWVKYYTDYTFEREYDFVTRFRTGEVAIGVSDYFTYNTLQVAAPEIDGLWGFTTVPGTVLKDGTVNKSVTAGGTGDIIMANAKDKEAAWEFLKWWTSTDTQVRYAREMESLMGASARYPTANKEALSLLPWPVEDYKTLAAQLETVKGIPQIPGGYYNIRNINNAFYEVVVNKKVGAREALTDAVRYIDDEITNKRKEFGLDE